ncbi:MAG: hypothetical protein KJ069_24225 [Anaerolineae bacterium]|nr:hypothetical protein [Anaerolineae bacterium]
MAKSEVHLTQEQARKNAEILAHLEAERRKLIEDTRALQEQSREERRLARLEEKNGSCGSHLSLSN